MVRQESHQMHADSQSQSRSPSGQNRRARRDLHRFTEQLDDELQEALDAARGRSLAPIESIARRCKYVLARYVNSPQGRALPKQLSHKPSGIVVSADLAVGFEAIEPHLLDACVQQLDDAIEALRQYDGKPFRRKPIAVGRGTEPGGRAEGDEERSLERLAQAAAELVNLFRDAMAVLSTPTPQGEMKPVVKVSSAKPDVLTPPQFAEELGVHTDKVYAWIRSAELRATDTATKRGGRPRYRISRTDADDFQRRRQNSPPPPSPRRKKQGSDGESFY
jgi:excisionase family DNA binding protein